MNAPTTHYPDYGRRGADSSRSLSRRREQCPKCDRLYHANGIKRHLAACSGKPEEPPAEPATRGHSKCQQIVNGVACGRLKRKEATRCFRCAGWSEPELATRLDQPTGDETCENT